MEYYVVIKNRLYSIIPLCGVKKKKEDRNKNSCIRAEKLQLKIF